MTPLLIIRRFFQVLFSILQVRVSSLLPLHSWLIEWLIFWLGLVHSFIVLLIKINALSLLYLVCKLPGALVIIWVSLSPRGAVVILFIVNEKRVLWNIKIALFEVIFVGHFFNAFVDLPYVFVLFVLDGALSFEGSACSVWLKHVLLVPQLGQLGCLLRLQLNCGVLFWILLGYCCMF